MLKISGLLILLLSCTLIGVYKSNMLSLRSKKLDEICIALEKLAELINCGTGELSSLLMLSFESDVLEIKVDKPVIKTEGLLKEDIELLDKLLKEIGIYDREKEYKQIMLYKTMFMGLKEKAMCDTKRLCKLYNSLGFLIGLTICIFLI